MIEMEYVCKECGTINNFIIGNTPIITKFDLSTNDEEKDFEIVNSECDVCGAENKMRIEIKLNPSEVAV